MREMESIYAATMLLQYQALSIVMALQMTKSVSRMVPSMQCAAQGFVTVHANQKRKKEKHAPPRKTVNAPTTAANEVPVMVITCAARTLTFVVCLIRDDNFFTITVRTMEASLVSLVI